MSCNNIFQIVLHCITLNYAVFYHEILFYITLYLIMIYYVILQYIILCCIVSHHILVYSFSELCWGKAMVAYTMPQ